MENNMDLVKLTVRDEENERIVELSITPQQKNRACNDQEYLRHLIDEHDRTTGQVPVQVSDDENSKSTPNTLYIWSDECIYLLLSLYEEHQADFKVKRHKKVFEEIAKKMQAINLSYTMSGGQCQSKLNSLKKMYKKIIDHNATSGNDRATWPYFDRMHELFGSSGWARPVATASEAGPESNGPSTSTSNQVPKRKLDATFEEYIKEKKKQHQEKAQAKKEFVNQLLALKEKQHKEKMELLWAIRNSLNNK